MENNNSTSTEVMQQVEQFKLYLSYDVKNERLIEDSISFAINHQLFEVANEFIEHAINNGVCNDAISAHKGFICIVNGDFFDAIEWLQKVVDNEVKNQGVLYNLAYANFMNGDINNTLTIINTYDIGSFDGAKILKARCLHHQGLLVEAKELLTMVTAPERSIEAKSLLSLVLYDLDELDAAYELSCDMLSQKQTMEAMLAKASIELEKQDFKSSEESFTSFCEHYPTIGRGWSSLASLQFRNFELDKALPTVEHALEVMPDHIGTWHILAWIHIMQGNIDKGLSAFESSYKLDRSFGETHGGLASIYALKGNTQLAKKHIKLAKRLDPNCQSLIFAQMVLLNKEGKHDESNKLFSETINTVNPLSGEAPAGAIKERLEYLSTKNVEEGTIH